MREARDRLATNDTQVIGVATRADYQAQDLIEAGMPFPLLLDPENDLRHRLGIAATFRPLRLLHPRGAVAYLRAARQARNFAPIWSQATQRPAVIVLNRELDVTWSHVGKQLGDYPSVEEVVRAVDSLPSP